MATDDQVLLVVCVLQTSRPRGCLAVLVTAIAQFLAGCVDVLQPA